jgi:hypothetical protein
MGLVLNGIKRYKETERMSDPDENQEEVREILHRRSDVLHRPDVYYGIEDDVLRERREQDTPNSDPYPHVTLLFIVVVCILLGVILIITTHK